MDDFNAMVTELEKQLRRKQGKLVDIAERKIQRFTRSARDRLSVLRTKLSVGQRDRVKQLFDIYISDVVGEVQKLLKKVDEFTFNIPEEVLDEINQLSDAPLQPEVYNNPQSFKPQQRRYRNPYRQSYYDDNEYDHRSSLMSALRHQGPRYSPEPEPEVARPSTLLSSIQELKDQKAFNDSQINVKQNEEDRNSNHHSQSSQHQPQQIHYSQPENYYSPMNQLKQNFYIENQYSSFNFKTFSKKQAQIRKLNFNTSHEITKDAKPAHTYVDKFTIKGRDIVNNEEPQQEDITDNDNILEDSEDEQLMERLPEQPMTHFNSQQAPIEDEMQKQNQQFNTDSKHRSYAKLEEKLLVYTCEICKQKFQGKFFKLRQHLQEAHNIFEWFRCLECGSMHQNTSSLSEHIFMTHNVTYNGQHQKFQYRCKVTNKFYNPMESMKHIADTVEYHRQPPDGYICLI